jgi:hypothetical protein
MFIKESTKFLRCKKLRSLLPILDIAKAFGNSMAIPNDGSACPKGFGNKWREWIAGPSIWYLGV